MINPDIVIEDRINIFEPYDFYFIHISHLSSELTFELKANYSAAYMVGYSDMAHFNYPDPLSIGFNEVISISDLDSGEIENMIKRAMSKHLIGLKPKK